jgi:glycosyltransferase involved in cell wall biosynthesis
MRKVDQPSKKPIVSIIVPCFNYGHFISDTIASIEKCDSRLYELIIVNDGSTDLETQKTLKKLEIAGYHVINQENKGVSAARNAGISAAKGKYILPLDADDEIYPSYLKSAINLLEKNSEVGVVYGRAEFFGAQQGEWKLPKFDVITLLIFNYIYVSAIYRRDIWLKVGGYDTDSQIDGWEDWDFWISVAEREWKFVQLDEMVFRYRIHEASKMYSHRINDKVPPEIQQHIISRHAAFYITHYISLYNSASRLKHWENYPFRGIARLLLTQLRRLTSYKKR